MSRVPLGAFGGDVIENEGGRYAAHLRLGIGETVRAVLVEAVDVWLDLDAQGNVTEISVLVDRADIDRAVARREGDQA